jgi:hypothetical protein
MKQTRGFGKEVKTAYETDNETVGETWNETNDKQNEKDTLGPVISSERQIVTGTEVLTDEHGDMRGDILRRHDGGGCVYQRTT